MEEGAGQIVAIGIAAEAGAEMLSVENAELIAGVGLRGDRYAKGVGTWTGCPDDELTLVEAETASAAGVADPLLLRRNVVTRGVRLDSLIGRRFALGQACLEGIRPCDPCGYLEGLISPGLKASLEGRGGLRARILRGGRIRVGDSVMSE